MMRGIRHAAYRIRRHEKRLRRSHFSQSRVCQPAAFGINAALEGSNDDLSATEKVCLWKGHGRAVMTSRGEMIDVCRREKCQRRSHFSHSFAFRILAKSPILVPSTPSRRAHERAPPGHFWKNPFINLG
jgi:hypothetical protein